jgi:hypothetical protein
MPAALKTVTAEYKIRALSNPSLLRLDCRWGIMNNEFMSHVLEFGDTKIDSTSLAEVCRR